MCCGVANTGKVPVLNEPRLLRNSATLLTEPFCLDFFTSYSIDSYDMTVLNIEPGVKSAIVRSIGTTRVKGSEEMFLP